MAHENNAHTATTNIMHTTNTMPSWFNVSISITANANPNTANIHLATIFFICPFAFC